MRLNKTNIERIGATGKTRFDWDDTLSGFGVRTTAKGAKAFIIQSRVNGRTRRVTLGKVGVMTVDQARKRARAELVDMADGVDPVEAKRQAMAREEADKTRQVTLRQAWDEYRASNRKDGKERKQATLEHTEKNLTRNFSDWMDRPIAKITREGVAQRHRAISQRSTSQADQAFRYLRSIINYAIANHTDPQGVPLLPPNPVGKLKAAQQWHKPKRRRYVIKTQYLGQTVLSLEEIALNDHETAITQTGADFLLFLLFTGLRKSEASTLKRADIGADSDSIFLPDPKNRTPVTIPLSDEASAILKRRYMDSDYVFAGRSSGHVNDPRGVRARVADAAGGHFTNHDLRRTFASIAESDGVGVGVYTLKRLVNHAIDDKDVTEGYVTSEFNGLRSATNRVSRFIREKANIASSSNVVHMEARA